MTPYHKLPLWWDLCDAIRVDLNNEFPRMALADYLDENGHPEMAQGIRDAWREGAVYFDEYEYGAMGLNPENQYLQILKIDFNRGFVVSVSCPHFNMVRRKLGELVRANIVLWAQPTGKHAGNHKNGRYEWRYSADRVDMSRAEILPYDMAKYNTGMYASDRDATIGLSRMLISQAIEQNCDGSEGKFLCRHNGANLIVGNFINDRPSGFSGGLEGFMRSIGPMPGDLSPLPIAASESPSVDPSCTDQPD